MQEVWKVSTAGGARRVKKGSSAHEASTSSNQSTKESEASSKSGISALLFPATNQPSGSTQTSKAQNVKIVPGAGSTPECEETVAESVADENGPFGSTEQKDEVSKNKSKDVKGVKAGQSSLEEKKVAKPQDDKRSRPKKIMEFNNIKISQVELCITYEGQRFVVNDMKLLMDQFVRAEFTGTWQRLFSRVKKHIIWGVLKSVTGMQGKKFKDKGQNQPIGAGAPEGEANLSDTEGHAGKPDKFSPSWPKRPTDGAGDGFVTSVRGIFNSQRRKAKKLLKPKKDEAENEGHGDLSENEVETTHFARQLTIIKAKKLFKRDNKKPPHSKGQKGSSSIQNEELPSSSKEAIAYDSDSSSGSSSSYELILE